MTTVKRSCLSCYRPLDRASARGPYLYGSTFGIRNIIECPSCGLSQVDRLPSTSSLDEYYRSTPTENILFGLSRDEIQACSRPSTLDSALVLLSQTSDLDLRAELAFLDIGGGNGRLVNNVRTHTNWKTFTVEPDPIKCKTLEALGIAPFRGTFEEFQRDIPDGYFHVISINQVLEHLHQPRGILESIRRILAPGGVLWIDVPNCTEAYFRSRLHDSAPHLTFWTAETLQKALVAAGFRVVTQGSFGPELRASLPVHHRLKRRARHVLSWYLPRDLFAALKKLKKSAPPRRVIPPEEVGKQPQVDYLQGNFDREALFSIAHSPV